MFLPRYGWWYLSKSKEIQWATIQEKIVSDVDLTPSSVSAMKEKLWRGLRIVRVGDSNLPTD